MATPITLSDLKAFPIVRGNTRATRSFTEQNVANLISNLFVDMSNGDVHGFTVCIHDENKVLFNIAGRFFDLYFTVGDTLWVAVNVDTNNGINEIADVYRSDRDDFTIGSFTHKLQILDAGKLVNQIHLYAGTPDINDYNAYPTKLQVDDAIAVMSNIITDELGGRITTIENIDTIDGGTIPQN